MGIRSLTIVACLFVMGGAGVASRMPQSPEAQQGNQSQPRRPTFRGGAVFVRVDVYPTKQGQPITDLAAEDLEVREDGALQTISAFEHVTVTSGGWPSSRVEPRTEREMRDMAGDPRARLFLVFLDKPHLRMSSGYRVIRPLGNFLRRLIGADDMVGMMTPEMSALDVMFTRRADRLAAWLQSASAFDIGTSSRRMSDDPVEERYKECFRSVGDGLGPLDTPPVAQEMIERRRERRTLDALTDLVRYVNGLRDERKALVLVSEGYRLFRPNPGLVGAALTVVNPDGTTRARRVSAWCAAELTKLSQLDNQDLFHDLMAEANHANVSFYPVDPRGLAVFDSEMGPEAPPPVDADMRQAHDRQESLDLAARLTDGLAVITNDIDAGLQKVVADLSSYYLIGYASTNGKLDGRFRSIAIRSKRPGVEIRARRGYRVPTAAEVAAAEVAGAPRVVDEAAAAVERAVATLGSLARAAPLRVRASAGWLTAAAAPASPMPPLALWVYGEVDVGGPGGQAWSGGGHADVAVSADSGEYAGGCTIPIGPGGSFVARLPQADGGTPLSPGPYSVRIRARQSSGGDPVAVTVQVELSKPADAGAFLLGEAIYARRGPVTGNKDRLTADLRFRRTEHLVIEMSATLKPDSVSGELLDRTGKPLAVPVAVTVVEKEGAVWVHGDLAVAPLAPGDYVACLTAVLGGELRRMLAPFRVVQ